MAKRGLSKAEQVLQDARNRRDNAARAVQDAFVAHETAVAILKVHDDTYNALEKSLAREPRKKAVKKDPVLPMKAIGA